MIFKLVKLVYKAFATSFFLQEITELFKQEMQRIQEEMQKKINSFLLKIALWIFTILLLFLVCAFLLIGLASYINDMLYSSYKGFLVVAGVCLLLSFLLGIISKVTTKKK